MRRKIGVDFPIAIMAFLIALLLWFHVVTEKEYVQDVKILLNVENEPEELVLLTTPPHTIHMRISGTGKELLKYKLGRERRFCRLDISGAIRGEVTYRLEEENFELPYGLALVDISDNQLQFTFDRRSKRSVRVRTSTTGSPEEGYTIVRESSEPDKISLSGPEVRLRDIDAVESEPIDIDRKSRPFQVYAKLVPPEGRGWVLTPDSVLARFLIEKILAATYDSVPVEIRNPPRRRKVSVSPKFIKLTLSGAESTMRELDITEIVAEIDIEVLRKGEYSLPARIKLPEGMNLISAIPKRFDVTIE